MLRRNATFLVISALTLAAAVAVWVLRGMGAVQHALAATWDLILTVLPSILGGLLLSAALRQLVPPGALARWMGAESGLRGLLVATAAGMVMPGGPVAAFPVVLVLAQAGADRGALIAFVLAWSLNGFQRIVVWELPILGPDFALLRLICGLPLPILAGLFARWLPIRWTPADAPGMQPRHETKP
ncbi:permease [Falsiroseomonas sp.]|uniref:permease n=1 Tax=Falsiroseomonas sp. TaxID=2870721 RepID=UPI0027251A9D|nr:permease [Falsiroseomonas sp.]MDO9500781.1 permease [Falsiroseomonas sp.]MDP3415885.1 permease [Falsiroseomonas sp.]